MAGLREEIPRGALMRGTPHFVRAFIAEGATLQANKFFLAIAATLFIIFACITLAAHAAQVQFA
jgi:hypothetical protein